MGWVIIKKNKQEHKVTDIAYTEIFKKQGYEIISVLENANKVTENVEKDITQPKPRRKKTTEGK